MNQLIRAVTISTALSVLVAVPGARAMAPGTAQLANLGSSDLVADEAPFDLRNLPTISATTLRNGSAKQAGLLPRYVKKLEDVTRQGTKVQAYGHPAYPGAVVLAARNGIIAKTYATGYARRYANPTTSLPRKKWIKARSTTIYDLASLSKTFTATLVVQLLAKKQIRLDESAAHYLPEFAQGGKSGITIRQLLTHTSGLAPDPTPALWDPVYTNNGQRWSGVFATIPDAAPGEQYAYSDINYLVLGKIIEKVTGKGLSAAVRAGITKPLGLKDTMYNPSPRLRKRIAATEYQEPPSEPARGMVWGQVHDENAWALGGVAGHAGLFSTAHDLAIFCQTILNGGSYGKVRIFPKSWAKTYFRDYNKAYPGYGHSLTMQVNQYPRYFGAMDTNQTIGHTGYTGTSLVIDPHSKSFNVLLTNRVHPTRDWTPWITPNPQRAAVGDVLARAIAVKPKGGKSSWFSGMTNNPINQQPLANPATVTVPVSRSGAVRRLTFNLWYRLVPNQLGQVAEQGTLMSSTNGGTSWQPLGFTLRIGGKTHHYPAGTFSGLGIRGWGTANATLPSTAPGAGPVLLRWQYTNGSAWQGRGLYVNRIMVTAGGRTVFDDSRRADAREVKIAGGFRASTD